MSRSCPDVTMGLGGRRHSVFLFLRGDEPDMDRPKGAECLLGSPQRASEVINCVRAMIRVVGGSVDLKVES